MSRRDEDNLESIASDLATLASRLLRVKRRLGISEQPRDVGKGKLKIVPIETIEGDDDISEED